MSGGPEEAFPASISESSCSLSYNDDIMTTTSSPRLSSSTTTTEPVVIAGAGIVGLVLALALDKHLGIKPRIFDQAPAFHDGVGAGIGMYPNGLRVIKDISPLLLARIQHEGIPYRQRRWERHDGTEVMTADESVISDDSYAYNLEPMGIRRWKLQKLLYEAVLKRGMIVEFGKKIKRATAVAEDNSHSTIKTIALEFFGNPNDTTVVHTELLLAADGAKSAIRESLHLKSKLTLTGTTCMYGVADLPYDIPPGLSLPSSETTKCHGAFYATDKREQCFQFHMPTKTHQQLQQQPANSCNDGDDDEASSASSIMHAVWDPLSSELCREECQGLAEVLADEGWNETKYLRALRHAHKAIKVPFALLEPPLETFLYTDQKRIVLVGDAAHPPVPYLGQGAQQGLEDAGTLALCLKGLCVVSSDHGGKKPFFDGAALDTALKLYDKMRVPRTRDILEKSKNHGLMQQKRAEAKTRTQARARENLLQRDVFFHETLQDVLPGATYDYKEAVVLALKEEPLGIILEDGFSDDDENEAKSQGHDQVRQGEIGDTLS